MSKWELIEKHWPMMSAQVKRRWSKLEDLDLSLIAGKEELLVRKLTEHYGLHQDDAQHQVFEWAKGLSDVELTMPASPAYKPAPHPSAPVATPPASHAVAPVSSFAADNIITK